MKSLDIRQVTIWDCTFCEARCGGPWTVMRGRDAGLRNGTPSQSDDWQSGYVAVRGAYLSLLFIQNSISGANGRYVVGTTAG